MSATISPRTIETVRLEADGASGRACFYEVALERITYVHLHHHPPDPHDRCRKRKEWAPAHSRHTAQTI